VPFTGINGGGSPKGARPWVHDEVELTITQLVPGTGKIEGRTSNFPQPEDVAIEVSCPGEVAHGDAHVVQRLDLDHGSSSGLQCMLFALSRGVPSLAPNKCRILRCRKQNWLAGVP
jgi:hypothetical protein